MGLLPDGHRGHPGHLHNSRSRWLRPGRTVAPQRDRRLNRVASPAGVFLIGRLLREEGTGSRWHIIMAGNMFVVVPMILTFLAAQRHIIRAFTFTSLK
jgi:hypothetical protein